MEKPKTPERRRPNKFKRLFHSDPRSPKKERARGEVIHQLLRRHYAREKGLYVGDRPIPYGSFFLGGTAWGCPACVIVFFKQDLNGTRFALLCPKHQTHRRGHDEDPETDLERVRSALKTALLTLDGAGDLFATRQGGKECLYYGTGTQET